MTAQTKRASTADARRLLQRIDELEADMNGLQAQFVAKLEEYTSLLDRMRSSPLWPDTVAELRATACNYAGGATGEPAVLRNHGQRCPVQGTTTR